MEELKGVNIPKHRAIDIDTQLDLEIARHIINSKINI